MRADRLLSIVWLLRAHGQLSTADLARRLEVSRRTIMRDIDALSTSGVPVYCERGPLGGVNLLPGYRIDVSALTSEESQALFTAFTAWGADSLGLGDSLNSGMRKLLAAVPEADRTKTSNVSNRVVIDPQGWLPQPERERLGETFRTIQDAVFSQHRILIDYRQKTRASSQTAVVDPHGLISAGRSWYLCCSRDEELLFIKLSRIDLAEALPDPCRTGHNIDVQKAWNARRQEFQEQFEAVLATAWVRDTRWSDVQEWVIRATESRATVPAPSGEGWVFLELEFVDQLHAMTVLLRLGPDAYLVTPAQLRQDFTQFLQSTLSLYGATPASTAAAPSESHVSAQSQ